jgi:hypothetical protein
MKTAQERENLRRAVLEVLSANTTQFGLGLDAITLRLTPFGFEKITAPEVEAAMLLLEKEGMIGPLDRRLSPGVRVWRITDEGRNFLAESLP